MNRRFFSPTPLVPGDSVTLAASEAHHLLHVLRSKAGDELVLFDGQGTEGRARVVATGRREVVLEVIQSQQISREARRRLTLAVALPKGDRQKFLVEKCVELGVAEMVPLITERGVSQPQPAAIAKLQRAVIEASKQCQRNQLMTICEPADFSEWILRPGLLGDASSFPLLAHPGPARSLGEVVAAIDPVQAVAATIGPEGGFAEHEVEQAVAAGWQVTHLGPRILRIETAALAVAACLVNG